MIPQVLNLPGEPIDGELPLPLVKIVGPQFTVRCIAGEHMKDAQFIRICRCLELICKERLAPY